MSAFTPYPKYPLATPKETVQMVQDLMISKQAADQQMSATLIIGVLALLAIWMLVGLYRENLSQLPAKVSDGALNAAAAGFRVWGNMRRGAKSVTDEVKRRADQ